MAEARASAGSYLLLVCALCLLAGYWYARRRSWVERVAIRAWEVLLWGPETSIADTSSAVIAAAGVATPVAARQLTNPRARRVAGAAAALLVFELSKFSNFQQQTENI